MAHHPFLGLALSLLFALADGAQYAFGFILGERVLRPRLRGVLRLLSSPPALRLILVVLGLLGPILLWSCFFFWGRRF